MSHRGTTTAASPQTLFDIAGIQARIHTLPGRPPFMVAPDLAEVYQTLPKRLAEAVKRNPRRFREQDCFRLTEAETALLKSQSATSMMANRDFPMAFTHTGAYALSIVLTSDVAIETGHALTDAFAAMEAHAMEQAQKELLALRSQITGRRPLYSHLRDAFREDRTFQEVKDDTRRSQREIIEKMITVMANERIAQPLRGTPMGRFNAIKAQVMTRRAPEAAASEADADQPDLFAEG